MGTVRSRWQPKDTAVTDMPAIARLGGLRLRLALAMRYARRLAKVEPTEFATSLRAHLAMEKEASPVTAKAVVAYESGQATPSAAVLLAAAAVAGVEVELLFHRPSVLARLQQVEDRLRRQAEQLRDLRQHLACR